MTTTQKGIENVSRVVKLTVEMTKTTNTVNEYNRVWCPGNERRTTDSRAVVDTESHWVNIGDLVENGSCLKCPTHKWNLLAKKIF
jgi:hypothetical protein